VKLADLFSAPPAGHMDLAKTWGNVGGLVISAGFLKQAWARPLGFDDFLGYAIALAMITTPALAAKFLGLRYGQGNGAPAPEGAKP
jgi:hypothetical protein